MKRLFFVGFARPMDMNPGTNRRRSSGLHSPGRPSPGGAARRLRHGAGAQEDRVWSLQRPRDRRDRATAPARRRPPIISTLLIRMRSRRRPLILFEFHLEPAPSSPSNPITAAAWTRPANRTAIQGQVPLPYCSYPGEFIAAQGFSPPCDMVFLRVLRGPCTLSLIFLCRTPRPCRDSGFHAWSGKQSARRATESKRCGIAAMIPAHI